MVRRTVHTIYFLLATTFLSALVAYGKSSEPDELYFAAERLIGDALPGEDVAAERDLIQCLRLDPKHVDAMLLLAQLTLQQVQQGTRPLSEMQRAFTLVGQAFSLASERPKVRFHMAHLFASMGQADSARDLYFSTLHTFPHHKETYIERAKVLAEYDPKQALGFIEKAMQSGARIEEMRPIVVDAYEAGPSDSFAERLEAFAKQHPDRWLWHKVGMGYLEKRNYVKSEAAFRKAIECGNVIESRLQLGVMEYVNEKKYAAAVEDFNTLLQTMEQRPTLDSSAKALVFSHLSLAYFQNKELKNAEKSALSSAKLSMQDKQYFRSLVLEYRKLKSLSVLKDALSLLVQADPVSDFAYQVRAEMYEEQKNYDQALSDYSLALALNDKNESVYARRGAIYHEQGNYELSLKDFTAASELKPTQARHIYNRACALARLGRFAEALVFLKKAVQLDVELKDLAATDRDFLGFKSQHELADEFASLVFQHYDARHKEIEAVKEKPLSNK